MLDTILTDLNNGILTVTINRPDKLNALNRQVFNDLETVLDEVYSNDDVKSVIITGAGTKAFVAGADITEFSSLDAEAAMMMAKRGQDIFFRIENSPKPVIACVNGFALGGGCELSLACHFRIASENARFGQPEVNLGLVPGYGGTQRLTKLVGKGRAIEYLITGAMIDANTALQIGLVNYVVPAAELLKKAIDILNVVQSKAPIAVAECITCANQSDTGIEGYAAEVSAFGHCFNTSDRQEGTQAFLEKRTPKFQGK
jgi:enoyl-CoA hydratase